MNRVSRIAQGALWTALILSFASFAALRSNAQQAQPAAPSQNQAQKPADNPPADKQGEKKEEGENPFAPEPAPTLPPGMSGSDANDPRANLKPGLL